MTQIRAGRRRAHLRQRTTGWWRILVAASLVLPIMFLSALVSGAVVANERATASRDIDLREAPSSSAPLVRVIPAGDQFTITGKEQGGFVSVTYRSTDGWIAAEIMDPSANDRDDTTASSATQTTRTPDEPTGEAVAVESLVMRADPDPDAKKVLVVPAGAVVETYDLASGLYRNVRYDGEVGWVRSIYLDGAPPLTKESDPSGQSGPLRSAPSDTGTVSGVTASTVAELVLRAEPSSSSEKLGVVPIGSSVTLTGTRAGQYAEVEFEKQRGWVAAAYLNWVDPLPSAPPAIPVLMYHSIQPTPAEYQITAWQVEEQLAWLAANGYTTITSADLLAWMTDGVPLPEKPIMITIDDGNASDWLFLELLEKYGLQGVFFLPNYAQLSAAQIRTLHRAGEVCGHSVSHPFLAQLPYDQQLAQVAGNKQFLDEVIGQEITCFAYPYGSYNGLTTSAVIEAGYLIAYDFNSTTYLAPLNGTLNRWHVDRINVSGYYSLSDFIAVIGGA